MSQTMPGMQGRCKQPQSPVGVVSIVRSPAPPPARRLSGKMCEPRENCHFHAATMAGVASLLTLASSVDDQTR